MTATSNTNNYGLTHALSGTDAGKFTIESSSGQIKVKSGTSLDYESGTTSYSVVVTMTAAVAQVQLVHPRPERARRLRRPRHDQRQRRERAAAEDGAPTVTQNTATPKTKLDVSWTALTTDQMAGKPAVSDYDVQYKKSSDSTWSSHSFTGTGTSTTLTGLDEGAGYDVQVRAVNDEGDGAWSDSGTTNTQDENVDAEFPDQTATRSIAENSAAGSNVGAAVTATDTENHTLYYSLNGTDKDSFDIGLNTGQITVKTGHVPNYEAKTSYSVTVEVSDRKDSNDNADTKIDDTIAVTINVTDVAEPPAAPTISVSASSTTPTTKIDVSWTAPDMTGKPAITDYDVRYRLSTATRRGPRTAFTGTGTSTTLTGLTAGKSYEVQVRAVNAEGNGAWSASGTAITRAGGVTRSIAENSAAGTAIGAAVTATSNPNSYTFTHTLSGTDASSFTIVSSSGQIKVKSDLDYETKNSYSVTVTLTAAIAQTNSFSLDPNAPGDYVIPVTINVTDVNDKPTFDDGDTTTRSIRENSAAGTVIGKPVPATDQDGDTLTYSLTGTDASKFTIDSSTGQIKVKSALDYEAKTSYSVTVNVTDKKKADGTADSTIDDTIAVTINVTDMNEPPPAPAKPTVSGETVDSPESQLGVTWTAPTDMTGKPKITDYDVQYRKTGGGLVVDLAQLHRHGHEHDAHRPRRRQELRRAGARGEPRGQRRLVGLGHGHHQGEARRPQVKENSDARHERGHAHLLQLERLHPDAHAGRNRRRHVRDQLRDGPDHGRERHDPRLRVAVVLLRDGDGDGHRGERRRERRVGPVRRRRERLADRLARTQRAGHVRPPRQHRRGRHEGAAGRAGNAHEQGGHHLEHHGHLDGPGHGRQAPHPEVLGQVPGEGAGQLREHVDGLQQQRGPAGRDSRRRQPEFAPEAGHGLPRLGHGRERRGLRRVVGQGHAVHRGACLQPGHGAHDADRRPGHPDADRRPGRPARTAGPGARESHPIALLTPANEPPSIINPGDKLYRQGDVIAAFGIDASDDGGPPLVEVAGLPDGLAFDAAAGSVFGRVAIDAPLGAHRVTVSATDGVLLASATFTITVTDRPAQPASPGTGHGPASAGGAPALAEPHGGAAALLLLALAAALPLAARRRTRA